MQPLLRLALVLLCAAPVLAAEPLLLADLRRTVDSRDETGKTSHTEEPIEVEEDDHEDNHHGDDDRRSGSYHGHRHGKRSGGSGGVIDVSGSNDSSFTTSGGPDLVGGRARSISVGYSGTNVFHSLTTRFESPSFSHTSWNTVPDIDGDGVEIAIHPVDLNAISLGVRGGFFQASQVRNAQQEGGLYVRESVKTTGGWANLEAQTTPFWGLSLLVGLGGLTYSVDTKVDTNAPVYRYDGLTGSRTVMIYGLGGQFEAPWEFPLKPYAQGRFWWTAGAGDPQENVIGQFSAGLAYRF